MADKRTNNAARFSFPSLDTPYVLVDGRKLDKNIQEMAQLARENRVELRPHVKTHKIPAIARKQIEAGAVGITVAKVSEAEVMADSGLVDIFVAYIGAFSGALSKLSPDAPATLGRVLLDNLLVPTRDVQAQL